MAPKKTKKTAAKSAAAKAKTAAKPVAKAAKPAAKTAPKPVAKAAVKPVPKPASAPVVSTRKPREGQDVLEYLRSYALKNPAMAVVGLVAILLVMLLVIG
jgi:hypothetical protein